MNELRVVVVEPVYQINMGYIARASKNFNIKRLSIVNPRCNYKGKEAIKYSKHARELLEGATVFKSIGDATKGTFIVGTTAIWRKTGRAFYNVYTPEGLLKLVKKNGIRKVSILIGRDNTGLTKDELAGCDANVFIPASDEYPALNISHALAIMLYVFSDTMHWKGQPSAPGYKEIERINKLFKDLVWKKKGIRDKKAVAMSFRHIVMRAAPTRKEIGALSVALSPKSDR